MRHYHALYKYSVNVLLRYVAVAVPRQKLKTVLKGFQWKPYEPLKIALELGESTLFT